MNNEIKYVKEDIERLVNYTISDYKYGLIPAYEVEKTISELEDVKNLIESEIEKLEELIGTGTKEKTVTLPPEHLSGSLEVHAELNKVREIIIKIARNYGIPPERVIEEISTILKE